MLYFMGMNIYLRDRLILVSLGGALLVNIILWIVVIGKFAGSKELLPLHFNIVYGIDFLGTSRQIYEVPLMGFVILVINFALGRIFFDSQKLLSYFLNFTSLFVEVILLVAVLALVAINF